MTVDPTIPGWTPERCTRYMNRNAGKPPREMLFVALREIAAPGLAFDIGCGPGREAEELLRRGWRVVATDAMTEMLARTRERAEALGPDALSRLELRHGTFLDTLPEPGRYDLIHAGFSLFFAGPGDFPKVWRAVVAGLRPGGFFAGQFLGPEDEFAVESAPGVMTAHGAGEVQAHLGAFDILHHEEVNRPEHIADTPKQWHIHHVVARKR